MRKRKFNIGHRFGLGFSLAFSLLSSCAPSARLGSSSYQSSDMGNSSYQSSDMTSEGSSSLGVETSSEQSSPSVYQGLEVADAKATFHLERYGSTYETSEGEPEGILQVGVPYMVMVSCYDASGEKIGNAGSYCYPVFAEGDFEYREDSDNTTVYDFVLTPLRKGKTSFTLKCPGFDKEMEVTSEDRSVELESLYESNEDYFSTEENGPFLFRSFEEVQQADEEHRYMASYVDGFLRYRRSFFENNVLILFQTALDEVSFVGSHIEGNLLVLHFTYHISDAIWPLFTRSYAFGLNLEHPISGVVYSMTNLFV